MLKLNRFNIKFFFFIFIAGILIGCVNAEGTLDIKGKVQDEKTKMGIPGKTIIVEGLVNRDSKPEPIEAGQFCTDNSGCFSYSLNRVKNARYYKFYIVWDSDYVFMTRTLSLSELEQNSEYLNFSLSKLAHLTIKLFRKSTAPVCDTLYLFWESNGIYGRFLYPYKINNYGGKLYSFGLTSELELRWIGGNVNSVINTKVFADKRTELNWELCRNGKRREFTDTLTCKRDFANIVYFTY